MPDDGAGRRARAGKSDAGRAAILAAEPGRGPAPGRRHGDRAGGLLPSSDLGGSGRVRAARSSAWKSSGPSRLARVLWRSLRSKPAIRGDWPSLSWHFSGNGRERPGRTDRTTRPLLVEFDPHRPVSAPGHDDHRRSCFRAAPGTNIVRQALEEGRELPPGDLAGTAARVIPPRPLPPLGSARLAFVYPGLGSFFAGMGRDLSALWPEILRTQDAALRIPGRSVRTWILAGRSTSHAAGRSPRGDPGPSCRGQPCDRLALAFGRSPRRGDRLQHGRVSRLGLAGRLE